MADLMLLSHVRYIPRCDSGEGSNGAQVSQEAPSAQWVAAVAAVSPPAPEAAMDFEVNNKPQLRDQPHSISPKYPFAKHNKAQISVKSVMCAPLRRHPSLPTPSMSHEIGSKCLRTKGE
eukprot:scaffold158721_cov21-Prasinocladus_malaysianus.AAC.1